MKFDQIEPVVYNFTYLLKLCGEESDIWRGREVHAQLIVHGFGSDLFTMTGAMNMYSKCKEVPDAFQVFDRMPERDLVSWNAMIAGFSQNGRAKMALELITRMQVEGKRPDSITIVTVLPSAASIGSLRVGKSIHGYTVRSGFSSFVNISTGLVDFYCKCGAVETARLIFDGMDEMNVVTWNSMIDGYAGSGHSAEALELFQKMLDEGFELTNVSVMAALGACGDLGDIEKERFVHEMLDKAGLSSEVCLSLPYGGIGVVLKRLTILNYDLDSQLAPRVGFLLNLSGDDVEATAVVIRRVPGILLYYKEHMDNQVEFMRSFAGLSHDVIFSIITTYQNLMSSRENKDEFDCMRRGGISLERRCRLISS